MRRFRGSSNLQISWVIQEQVYHTVIRACFGFGIAVSNSCNYFLLLLWNFQTNASLKIRNVCLKASFVRLHTFGYTKIKTRSIRAVKIVVTETI